MELIIISESKFKLMLTPADMASYTGNTKEVLRGIMNDVRDKCGFACGSSRDIFGGDGRIFVQMYPSREGGCELFVTKLEEHRRNMSMQAGEERTLTEYRKYIYRDRGSHIVYSFEEMRYLLSCCLGLYRMGYGGSSRAYRDPDKQKFYLKLDCETPVAGENFGSLCPSRVYYYINEHCDVICAENAVEKLGKLV